MSKKNKEKDIKEEIKKVNENLEHSSKDEEKIKESNHVDDLESKEEIAEFDEGQQYIASIEFLGTNIKEVVIPDTVILIQESAFAACSELESIYISKSVRYIEDRAFSGCYKLKRIVVDPENPYYDSRNDCNAIIETKTNKLIFGCGSTIIPEGVLKISDYAFGYCPDLHKIHIPASVIEIGYETFSDCNEIEEITVDEKNELYDSRYNCNAIICKCFNEVFLGCITTVIPPDVTGIGPNAFKGSFIQKIKIPKNIVSIEDNAFTDCYNLKSIKVDKDNKVFDSRDNCNAIIKTKSNKLLYGCRSTVIPASVKTLAKTAFAFSNIVNLVIPDNIKTLPNNAFEHCVDLKSIKLPSGLTKIPSEAFIECDHLKSIDIPESVTSIGDFAFCRCYKLSEVNLNKNLVKIGEGAFLDCSKLSKIELPKSLKEIKSFAFVRCEKLKNHKVPNKEAKIDKQAFEDLHLLYNLDF